MVTAYPLFLPNLGMGELAIIFVIILILFGPGQLPKVMKSLGDGMKQFKDAASGQGTPENTDKPQEKPNE
jgi:sec-independent protein translocase protein TatA